MAVDQDDSPGGLLSLPPEIMERIAEDLPAKDFLSLRLVCKDIEAKVLRCYSRKCFSERAFGVSSPWSMAALQGIADHPQFKQSMARVELELSQMITGLQDQRRHRYEPRGSSKSLNSEERVRHRDLRKIHQGLEDNERRLVAISIPLDGLSQSLRKLTASRVEGISIVIREHESTFPPTLPTLPAPCGLRRPQRTPGFTDCVQEGAFPRHLKERLLHCILDSGCPVSQLAIVGYSLQPYPFALLRSKQQSGIPVPLLSTIESLSVRIDVFGMEESDGLTGLRLLMAEATKLKVLKLRTSYAYIYADAKDFYDGPCPQSSCRVCRKLISTSHFLPCPKLPSSFNGIAKQFGIFNSIERGTDCLIYQNPKRLKSNDLKLKPAFVD